MKIRNHQLDSENTELSQKNSQNQKELQELNQRLAEVLCQKDKEPGHSTSEDWEEEKSNLKEELEHCKVQVWFVATKQPFWRRSQEINVYVKFFIHKVLIIRIVPAHE